LTELGVTAFWGLLAGLNLENSLPTIGSDLPVDLKRLYLSRIALKDVGMERALALFAERRNTSRNYLGSEAPGTRIIDRLKGADLRSISRSEEVVNEVLRNQLQFRELFEGIVNDEEVVTARCADAVEKVTRVLPEYLYPFKERPVDEVARIPPVLVSLNVEVGPGIR
jgi:hypothetical protein